MGPIHDSTFRDFVNGSDQAFTKVYEELKLHMLDYTRLRGLDRNQCEEAVAVTLLKVLEKRAKFHSLVHLNNFAAKCLEQSIQKLGRTLRQIPEDDFHESFENVMHLYYDGCSATDIAKLMNIERKIVDQYLKRGKRILGDRAGPGESDGPNQVAIGFHNGLLEVTPLRPDGSFVLSDDLYQTAAGIYVFGRSKWEPILRELSGLINKAGLKERELQDFFESYPELLLNDEYCRLIPQATIVKDDHCHWKADFVLVPYDQLSFAKILELKLPSAPISRSPVAGHHHYSGRFLQSIRQLQDYQRAFDSPTTRQLFKDKYQVDILKPDLQLVMGRRGHICDRTDFLHLQKHEQVPVNDWDSLFDRLRRRYR